MPLELFPQVATLFPNDKQRFTLRGLPPPVGWATIANGTVEADYSLKIVNTGLQMSAFGMHELRSGVGSVALTVDNQSLVTSTGRLDGYLIDAGSGYQMWFEATATQILVKHSNGPTTLATISHTLTAGNVLMFSMAGDRWRFYLNGVERAAWTPTSPNRYPGVYQFLLTYPVTSTPGHILPPVLVGDWQARDAQGGWAVTGGTQVVDSASRYTDYTAGVQPGIYEVSATVAGSALQKAVATVLIAPLAIAGPTAVTLQPSQVVRFGTNYDKAQTRLVAWSAIGGGAFSNDEYVAPSAPGTYTARAAYSTQQADITVTIPKVITSSVGAAVGLGEQATFTTNMTGTITWTADRGTSGPTISASFLWTAPAQAGEQCRIKATNGTDTIYYYLQVWDLFAYEANFGYEASYGVDEVLSYAEDGTAYARVKTRDGRSLWELPLQFRERNLTEWDAVMVFYDVHRGGMPFIYHDTFRNKRYIVYFASRPQMTPQGNCSIDYQFRLRERVTVTTNVA